MGGFIADAFGSIVAAEVDQATGVVAGLFCQFSLGDLFKGFPLVDTAGGNFPAVVFSLYISVLAHQNYVIGINERNHADTSAEGHDPVNRRAPVRHLGNIFA